jgi:glycogen debranching enzyme
MNDQVASETSLAETGAASPAGQPYLHEVATCAWAPAMALSGKDGQIRPRGAEGLFVRDVRALSKLVLRVQGSEPVGLRHSATGGATSEFYGIVRKDRRADPPVAVRRKRSVRPDGMLEEVTLRSYAPATLSLRADLELACDFAGIAAVKMGLPSVPHPASALTGGLSWEIRGRCATRAIAGPEPGFVDPRAGVLAWTIELPPHGELNLSVSVSFEEVASSSPVAEAPPGRAEIVPLHIEAGDHRLARWVDVSLEDLEHLRMVVAGQPEDVFLAAGIPWYLTLFGRDSLWSSRMLMPLGTELALGTLRALARRQGRSFDKRTAEEPGKMLHELRRGTSYDPSPAGRRNFSYFQLPPVYYGAVDTTPLWVCVLHDAWLWGAPEAALEALLEPMVNCLEWTAGHALGEQGFVSYFDGSGKGLSNQGWKDSADAVQFRDGRLATGPVALCEVQGYAYEAATDGAELLDAFGQPGAQRWREFAGELAERFRARFWVEDADGPYPAMALDGQGTPVDSLSSNIGHLLGTGILTTDEAELVARRLASPELSSGFGLRTLSCSSAGFNPVSYHCGSVWAHDTAIAIAGLARTQAPSAEEAAARLAQGLLAAAEGFAYRVPELYGGHDSDGLAAPVPYPASCHPQAWAAAASVSVVTSLLRLRADFPRRRVHLAPMALAMSSLRRLSGFRLGDTELAIEISPCGTARLNGLPGSFQVIT